MSQRYLNSSSSPCSITLMSNLKQDVRKYRKLAPVSTGRGEEGDPVCEALLELFRVEHREQEVITYRGVKCG